LTNEAGWTILTFVKSKNALIAELELAAQSMVQGSLSELTRQCGVPTCACASDPARRHGPHLYLKFSAQHQAHSVYVPPEQSEHVKEAHRAWLAFQDAGAQIAAGNRERLLRELQRDKARVKAQRAKAREKARRD
jgi:hypothetical protein